MNNLLIGTYAIEDFVGSSMTHVKFMASCGLLDTLKKDRRRRWTCDSDELLTARQLLELGRGEGVATNAGLTKNKKTIGRPSDESARAGLLKICTRLLEKPSVSSFSLEKEVEELFLKRPLIKKRMARRLLNLARVEQKNKHQMEFGFGETEAAT